MGLRRGRHIEVTIATTPKREDKRSRVSFDRVSPFHRKFAIRAWRRFGRKLDYVGEWHTHPEARPRPSMIDKAEWERLIRTSRAQLLFVIVGGAGLWTGISIPGRSAVQPMAVFVDG